MKSSTKTLETVYNRAILHVIATQKSYVRNITNKEPYFQNIALASFDPRLLSENMCSSQPFLV